MGMVFEFIIEVMGNLDFSGRRSGGDSRSFGAALFLIWLVVVVVIGLGMLAYQ